MARVPEGLAREALEWLADEEHVMAGDWKYNFCRCCEVVMDIDPEKRKVTHDDDCLHTRSAAWLAAEKAARDWRPRAKVVNRD